MYNSKCYPTLYSYHTDLKKHVHTYIYIYINNVIVIDNRLSTKILVTFELFLTSLACHRYMSTADTCTIAQNVAKA